MSSIINAEQWTTFDKIMYGGFGYGAFCLPTNFIKVMITIIFPPLGEIINIIEETIINEFPFFTGETFNVLFTYKNLNTIVYSFILTTLFYIPGLIYTLTNIVNKQRKVSYDIIPTQQIKIYNRKTNTYDDIIIQVEEGYVIIKKGNILIYRNSVGNLSDSQKTDLSDS